MTIKASQCPVDHSEDPELVQSFYRTVRSYALPRFPNITVKTVHRCSHHLTGDVFSRAGNKPSRRLKFITDISPTRLNSGLKVPNRPNRHAQYISSCATHFLIAMWDADAKVIVDRRVG